MRSLKIIYFTSDFLVVFSSLLMAGWLKFSAGIFQIEIEILQPETIILLFFLTFVFILIFRFLHIYRHSRLSGGYGHGRRILLCVAVGHFFLIIVFFAVKHSFLTERIFILISIVTMTLLLFTFRLAILPALMKLLKRRGLLSKNTLFIGTGEESTRLLQRLLSIKNGYFKVVATLDAEEDSKSSNEDSQVTRYCGIEEFDKALENHRIKEIVIAMDPEYPNVLCSLIKRCQESDRAVNVYSSLFSIVMEKMALDLFDRLPLVRFKKNGGWRENPIKRFIDLLLSTAALILLSPLMLLVAGLIKLTSRGPVFYIDTRIGRGEKPFRMLKFRSMRVREDDSKHKEYVTKFIRGEIKANGIYKLENDSRVTPIGKFLRRFSLDELPQLINVFKGEMSLVGPRPSLPYEIEKYEKWHRLRFEGRPGLTGLWQATARSEVPFEQMVALDLYYTFNAGFWLDVEILIRTVETILLGKGAV